jgi:hypothetical protein
MLPSMTTLALSTRLSPQFVATAAQTDFPADWPAFTDSGGAYTGLYVRQVRAGIATILDLGSFSVVGATDDGFTARLNAGAQAGDLIQVFGLLPAERDRAHAPGGQIRTDTLEADADWFEAQAQELTRDVGRAIRTPLGSATVDLPDTTGRAGKFLAFDAEGQPVATVGTGDDGSLRSDLAADGGAALVGTGTGQSVEQRLVGGQVIRKSETAYTLAPTDSGNTLVFTAATDVTITVPLDLGASFVCAAIQRGLGQLTFAEDDGVTLLNLFDQRSSLQQYELMLEGLTA